MIIGISGKIGSGKDTAGQIIQYLQYKFDQGSTISFNEYEIESIGYTNKWEVKKFAGKLKQIVSLLTGIPVQDFEKEEIKNQTLGDEWIKPNVLQYFQGSNQEWHDFVENQKSDQSFKLVYETSIRITDTISRFKYYQDVRLTVRDLLQQVGTNAMRDIIHPNIWCNSLFADYKCKGTLHEPRPSHTSHTSHTGYPNWIITDLRFPNEYKYIKKYEGINIRINRPYYPTEIIRNHDNKKYIHINNGKYRAESSLTDDSIQEYDFHNFNQTEFTWKLQSDHISETALDNQKFDYVINNDSSIEDLIIKIHEILIKEKLY